MWGGTKGHLLWQPKAGPHQLPLLPTSNSVYVGSPGTHWRLRGLSQFNKLQAGPVEKPSVKSRAERPGDAPCSLLQSQEGEGDVH